MWTDTIIPLPRCSRLANLVPEVICTWMTEVCYDGRPLPRCASTRCTFIFLALLTIRVCLVEDNCFHLRFYVHPVDTAFRNRNNF